MQRWRYSGLYPAFRSTAKVYRWVIRAKAALKLVDQLPAIPVPDGLRAFLKDCFGSEVSAGVVLMGTPGPAQKLIVQLWGDGLVLGYMKYGKTSTAKSRIEREHAVLSGLAPNIGPCPLKFAPFADGVAMIMSPVCGKQLPASLSSASLAKGLLNRMTLGVEHSVHEHPWIKRLSERYSHALPWLDALAGRTWPVVIQHGDFAPWNIFQDRSGILTAIDWEYSTLVGFPYLDHAFFILQVVMLMKRWPPNRARKFAVQELTKVVSRRQAQAIVKLAAFDAFHKSLNDGHDPDEPNQQMAIVLCGKRSETA